MGVRLPTPGMCFENWSGAYGKYVSTAAAGRQERRNAPQMASLVAFSNSLQNWPWMPTFMLFPSPKIISP